MSAPRSVWVAFVAGVLVIAAACALGAWQLRRAAGKEALQSQVEASARAPATVPDAGALRDPRSLVHRHLRLTGRWLPDHVVYLDNRPQAGRAGFYVLMTLRIDAPLPADVVVDRGWLPRDASDRARIAPYRTPAGVVELVGVALADEPRLLELAAPGDRRLGAIWQNFDFAAFGRASGRAPLPIVVRQDGPSGISGAAGDDDGLLRDWPDHGGELQAQIDRHHGYAFQWFALATTVLALAAYRIVKVLRHDSPVAR